MKTKTNQQEQRQRARSHGRYAKLPTCPCCGERRAVEPAYPVAEGGPLRNESKWAGQFICTLCIKKES
jgi:hypothetical protein